VTKRENILNAFILINVERGKLWKVAEKALEIEGVKIAHAVTGQYDVIAYAEFPNVPGLSEIIDKMQLIDSVKRTTTAIAMAPRLS
jgi:DNA-binding Lrp family transcriptional regulator